MVGGWFVSNIISVVVAEGESGLTILIIEAAGGDNAVGVKISH